MRYRLIPAVLLGACLASPAVASERTLTLSPEETQVAFVLGATGHDVHGTFRLDSGALHFDPAGGPAKGEIVIDARAGETGNRKRDRTMHRKVLRSDEYPAFVFHAEELRGEVAAAGRSEVELAGRLEIHGSEHPLTLPLTVEVEGDRVRATTRFEIPYVAWGLRNPSVLVLRVAKQVQVEVTANGTLAAATPEG